MALNIGKEIAALKRMTVPELRRKYAQVFGEDTTSRHKEYLIRRIVWRLQANQDGGLSERAKRRARDLATRSDVRLTAPRPRPAVPGGETTTTPIEFPQDDRLPMPGAVITRRYKNRPIRADRIHVLGSPEGSIPVSVVRFLSLSIHAARPTRGARGKSYGPWVGGLTRVGSYSGRTSNPLGLNV